MMRNEKGMATVETIPLLFIFVLFVGYGIGSFGVVHTGILNSIAARTYAFETFRHRPNLKYFRDESRDGFSRGQYYRGSTRIHGIQSETVTQTDDFILATERGISRGLASNGGDIDRSRQEDLHSRIDTEFADGAFTGRARTGTSIVWIKTSYGICLNAGCGD